MIRRFVLIAGFLIGPGVAHALCAGADLIAELPADKRAELAAVVDATPFSQGNLWRATKGGAEATIIGTYHLADPRHDATMDRITPLIAAATTVLVEASSDEEAAMQAAMGSNPGLILITDGPSLLEQMETDDWERLAAAMQARSIPPFMTAKFRPWYVAIMLGMPPCAMGPDMVEAMENGLDKRIINLAEDQGLPVRSLEPFDTIFNLFNKMTAEQQLAMIDSTMLFEDQAEDFSATLAQSYFAEDVYTIWAFLTDVSRDLAVDVQGMTEAEFQAEFALMEEAMINARNRAWIPVIEDASTAGPLFIAFGALHLPGEQGVLNLMEQAGWQLERLRM